jgi:hypothetical protein
MECCPDTVSLEVRIIWISWQDAGGITQTAPVRLQNKSQTGMNFTSDVEIPVNTAVYIAAGREFPGGYSRVRNCVQNGGTWTIAVELSLDGRQSPAGAQAEALNYYEFLQISPSAQEGTIHRVFRYLASLYHPDNPETGDPERFVLLNRAYEVLSNPVKRAAYDAELKRTRDEPSPAFAGIDFMDGVEGEMNRRLGVLAVLYRKCRSNINDAAVSLIHLENIMGFPREYLDFTTWYLHSKKYITRGDNSEFALTSTGVDFVEENYSRIQLLGRLLTAGTSPTLTEESINPGGGIANPFAGD